MLQLCDDSLILAGSNERGRRQLFPLSLKDRLPWFFCLETLRKDGGEKAAGRGNVERREWVVCAIQDPTSYSIDPADPGRLIRKVFTWLLK